MSIELKIPEVGESITEVQIANWLKAEGDAVQKDEPVAVIDSEKTTFELPAPESGTMGKILRQAGETVNVGDVIGQLEAGANGAASGEPKRERKSATKSKEPAEKTEASPPATGEAKEVEAASAESSEQAEAQPKAEDASPTKSDEKAEKKSPAPPRDDKPVETEDASSATEAEPEAKPVKKSPAPRAAKSSAAKTSTGSDEEIVPMTMLRRTVAKRLVEAKQQMAMLTTFNEVDMSAAQKLRHEHQEAFEKRHEVKLGLMSFFVKAAVDALKQFPQLNAEVRGNDIVYRNYFNIGVAIATGRGLVVPVLRNAERLSFADVEKSIGGFAQRAKEGKLKPDELEGATFTITNGGVFGSLLSTPIINPPQSGILGMHAIQERPVAVQGQVVIRPMMYLALTYDHRIVDGREAVLFIRRIKEAIETPARMLLEI